MMIGAWNRPRWRRREPSVAARLYAGAVEATPMTTLDMKPSAPAFRPLSRRYKEFGMVDRHG